MTDLQIAVILHRLHRRLLGGYLLLCERVGR